jgi:hypothetical protein
MRHRLYFVEPNLQAAQQAMNDLLLARLEERYIHCLSKRGAPMDGLHEANVLQKTDVVHGGQLGLVIGGAAGLIVGIILVISPPGGVSLQLFTVLFMGLGGAFFGMWAATLSAASVPNSRLLAYAKDVEEGRYLFMIDVPSRRLEEIREMIERRHPEATKTAEEPEIPAFP